MLINETMSTTAFQTAGQDATDQFFALHRFEVLLKPQYKRLIIGTIEGEENVLHPPSIGDISKIPYAEPTWLSEGYYSPYYTEVRALVFSPHCNAYTKSRSEPPRITEGCSKVYRRISSARCPGTCLFRVQSEYGPHNA